MLKNTAIAATVGLLLWTLAGCSGMAKGVTQAFLENSAADDTRKCEVKGRAFPGLEHYLSHPSLYMVEGVLRPSTLKILMVHGIGSHRPGYSTRLAENLAQKLDLKQIDENPKRIVLRADQTTGRDLGFLILNRYLDRQSGREMIFAELTWDSIVEREKSALDYDNSGEYNFRRANINNSLKLFVNQTIPDVLMYNGTSKLDIQLAIGQSMCWLLGYDWPSLPQQGAHLCDGDSPDSLSRVNDDVVFITHSLGSRITTDVLQLIAAKVSDKARTDAEYLLKKDILQHKEFPIFMLSNQLPLLQMGQEQPQVTNRIDAICTPGSQDQAERMFKEIKLIAFSDPNDLFSYAISGTFLNDHMDSRLCPTLTNIMLNVAPVRTVLGNEFANPLSAHTEYDSDERVLDLLTFGIGQTETTAFIKDRCRWLEALPSQEQK
ncbi:MAG: hypothetical protein R6W66_05610 [Pelovirga sp.]